LAAIAHEGNATLVGNPQVWQLAGTLDQFDPSSEVFPA
jgi:hypothetical protein